MKYNETIRKEHENRRSLRKRLCSIAVASTMFVTSMPTVLYENIPSIQLTASAANKDDFVPYTDPKDDITAASDGQDDGIYTIAGPDDLVKYSKCYISFPQNHQTDIIQLAFAGTISNTAADEFIAIGTESYPFKGKIITAAGSLNKLQLPEALFDYVADTAKIVASKADGASPSYIRLSRSTNSSNEPVLARHVVDNKNAEGVAIVDAADWIGNEWQVQIETFSSGTDAARSNYYAGIIGEMQSGTKMQISVKDGTSAEIRGTSDLGRICGSMGSDTMLTVKSIEGVENTSNSKYGITTSSGNVGGIVGSMAEGSVLVMGCQPANTGAAITTSNGYAGGIVGYNNGGTVKLDATAFASTPYTVSSVITGTAGVGGLYGYYCAKMDDPTTSTTETKLTLNIKQYNIAATENNTGTAANIGGLFGELVNPEGGKIIISGSSSSDETNSNVNLSNNNAPSAGNSGEVETDASVPSEDNSGETASATECSDESTTDAVVSDGEIPNESDPGEAVSATENSDMSISEEVVAVAESPSESDSGEPVSATESIDENNSEEVVLDTDGTDQNSKDATGSNETAASESEPVEETFDEENESISSEATSEEDSTTEIESDTISDEDTSGVVNITMANTQGNSIYF